MFAVSNWPAEPNVCYGEGMKTRVKELRAKKGWTIDQLADVSGVSRGFISQIENERRDPSAQTLADLAQAFGVHVSQLLADPDLAGDIAEAMRLLEAIRPEHRAAALRAMSGFVPRGEDAQ